MSDCTEWPAATVRREGEDSIWDETPPETHVADDFLESDAAMAFLETRYAIGEACTALPGTHHMRRVDQPADDEEIAK